eukprot:scaffold64137_cov96-Phaeocystis_antarctica.AAC.1
MALPEARTLDEPRAHEVHAQSDGGVLDRVHSRAPPLVVYLAKPERAVGLHGTMQCGVVHPIRAACRVAHLTRRIGFADLCGAQPHGILQEAPPLGLS